MASSGSEDAACLRAELERARAALAHMQSVARLGTWEHDQRTGAVTWSDELKRLLKTDPRCPGAAGSRSRPDGPAGSW